ncbi:M81 family metallopeptidase [Chelatococcus asaccharovorans]|uniref:Microcystin degradation protein MlrC n=1 Tax=Chelatococcus asaccharovorans TaxID=28210 RepID=A0A2V3UDS5_9HYPH|nr:M81 family metallopeptidase [Chelatococcus asaccharovorans]MBS7706990.1 M81 family metallopeptidase [Chelatococcus asaccharovorans]PXW63170.1 microcystin degradation protein MlrC [Chelatococcus asaccharovorans]
MTKRPRILLAALFHETHTFVDEITTLEDYTIRDVLDRHGDGSTVDGFLEVAKEEGWEVVPAADFTALPSGTTDHAVFELFWDKLNATLTSALADGGLDGIWLALHGAMVTTECVDPEGELLSRIRAVPGAEHLPLFGVFDLHANFTPAMARHANGLIAYRENPHIDARDSAVRSARLMARALKEKTVPHMVTLTAPLMWPPTGTGTADRPMRDLEALARRIEVETPAIWAANVVAGYSFSDTPDTGVSFAVITTADDTVAQSALQRLRDLAIELREFGLPEEWNLDAAVAHIKTLEGGPYVVVEPSDNIGGGAPGDGTAVLRAFLNHDFDNAAVAISDPAAVAALADAVPGETRRLSLGGKGSAIADPPIEVDARFVSRSDGNFTLEDRNSHLAASQGVHFAMGPSAVVTVGKGIKVLITSRKTPPFDLAQFRSQGIIPEDLKAIGVKAAVAHRRAYDPIAAGSFTVETAGPCTSRIATLPFRRLRRGVFPIHADWSPE